MRAHFIPGSWRFIFLLVTAFTVLSGNVAQAQSGTTSDGLEYTTSNGNVTITGYTGSGGAVTIPSTINGLPVTSIGEDAFYSSNLTSVTIPDSVTSIGYEAYDSCSNLTSVTIGSAVTSIGDYAFASCSNLTSVTIPDSVTSIGSQAFAATGLTSVTIPNGVSIIEDGAFAGTSLTSVTIPDGVTSIGVFAFEYCTNLTSVTIPDSVTSINDGAFQYCSNLTSITIPASVTSIGQEAFAFCTSLTAINVDTNNPAYSSVAGVLFNQSQTTLVAFPGGIGGSYAIPNSVKSIGIFAFEFCINLTSVTIPGSVTSIGDQAFSLCINLISLYFTGNAPSVGSNPFASDHNTTVYYSQGTSGWHSTFAGLPAVLLVPFTSTTSNGVITITGYTGPGGAVTIPGTINGLPVTSIGDNAFAGATLTGVFIPANVTSIGNATFQNCANLTSVNFIGNAPTVGTDVFLSDPNTTIYYQPGTSGWGATFDGLQTALLPFTFTDNNGLINITGYFGSSTVVAIPSEINGVPVTSVGDNAFFDSNLTGVTIPDGVISIGNNTFDGCANLSSLAIGNSVNAIGTSAFLGCSNLTSVTIPNGVASIANATFQNCSGLTSLTIGSGVTSIGANAFFECSGITSLTIPGNVTSIGSDAFFGCSGLTSVTIPASVTSIGAAAFAITSLTAINVDPSNAAFKSVAGVLFNNITTTLVAYPGGLGGNYSIPNGVTAIGNSAFDSCSSLTSVTIPNSVTTIQALAFKYCFSLTSITVGNNVSSIKAMAFNFCTSLASVYFTGNAPSVVSTAFESDNNPTVYYLQGATGWHSTFAGVPAVKMIQPAITTPAASEAVVAGANATFTAAATGTPVPTYQWQLSTDGGNSWNNVSGNIYTGATTANLTIANATTAQLGYQYQAVITNFAGNTTTTPVPLIVGSSNAKLTWLQNNFSAAQLGQPAIVADTATPANDGIPNLIKYAFNLNPFTDGHSSLPQPVTKNGVLSLTFPIIPADLAYNVEASTDMLNWSTDGVNIQSGLTQVKASYTLSGTTPAFLHIVIAPAP